MCKCVKVNIYLQNTKLLKKTMASGVEFLKQLPDSQAREFIGIALNDKIAKEYDKSDAEKKDNEDVEKETEQFLERYRKKLEKQRLKEILAENKDKHGLGMPRTPKEAVVSWMVEEKAEDFRMIRKCQKFHAFHHLKEEEFYLLPPKEQLTLLTPFIFNLKKLRRM